MLVMCVSFGLGWILSRANLKDVFVCFEDLKYHGLTDVLAVMRHHLTFEQNFHLYWNFQIAPLYKGLLIQPSLPKF